MAEEQQWCTVHISKAAMIQQITVIEDSHLRGQGIVNNDCEVSAILSPGFRILQHTVHATIMDRLDCSSPPLNVSKMLIKKRGIEGRVPIGAPRFVDEDVARNIYCPNAHALNVVQAVNKPLEVSAMTELRLPSEGKRQ